MVSGTPSRPVRGSKVSNSTLGVEKNKPCALGCCLVHRYGVVTVLHGSVLLTVVGAFCGFVVTIGGETGYFSARFSRGRRGDPVSDLLLHPAQNSITLRLPAGGRLCT